ncbi:hypothetical protein BCR34DRAFT_543101 [Clohesyomyces aquaticus]|uniref:Uncharacterized protein n=1 Tax=Clohesyomyces aquaticus TaxID=1231657 RepID=A0A1Y1Z917_9PLEO|nr:hypothetical protein BCR34DRAFT_543101 [Clohesyomyces aquaticus]
MLGGNSTQEVTKAITSSMVPIAPLVAEEEGISMQILSYLKEEKSLNWQSLSSQADGVTFATINQRIVSLLVDFGHDLRDAAQTPAEYEACRIVQNLTSFLSVRLSAWVRPQKPRLESQILEPGQIQTGDSIMASNMNGVADAGPPIVTTTLSFEKVKGFLFEGVAAKKLRDRFIVQQNTQCDHLKEMKDILLSELEESAPESILQILQDDTEGHFQFLLCHFLEQLLSEATGRGMPGIDIAGIQDVLSKVSLLEGLMGDAWAENESSPTSDLGNKRSLFGPFDEPPTESNAFSDFVSSSGAFTQFKGMFRLYLDRVGRRKSQLFTQRWVKQVYARFNPPKLGKIRVWYTCNCGALIYDDYSELRSGGIQRLQRRLKMDEIIRKYSGGGSSSRHSHQTLSRFLALFPRFRSVSRTQGGGSLPQHQAGEATVGAGWTGNCQTHTSVSANQHRYIHCCFPYKRYAMRMDPLRVCELRSDFDLFMSIRSRFFERRASSVFSFKKPAKLEFVKFTMYQRNLVDINVAPDIPPESKKDEYEYDPMPADTIPPVGSNLLMHYFENPEEASNIPGILNYIPKRKREKLELNPVAGSATGWGLDIILGADSKKLFLGGLAGCLISIAFGVAWSIARKDVQGAFGVASFTLAMFVLTLGALDAMSV